MESRDLEQRLRIFFRKGPEARFLSHLDLIATLEYAMRRAGFPLVLSDGFNPRPRMSVASPLPVGYVGEREVLEITLQESWHLQRVRTEFSTALPVGLEIIDVLPLEASSKKAAARIVAAVYRIDLPGPIGDLAIRISTLLCQPSLEVVEVREEGNRTRNLRPLVHALEMVGSTALRLVVALSEGGTVRPEQILQLMGIPLDGVLISRESIELAANAAQ